MVLRSAGGVHCAGSFKMALIFLFCGAFLYPGVFVCVAERAGGETGDHESVIQKLYVSDIW